MTVKMRWVAALATVAAAALVAAPAQAAPPVASARPAGGFAGLVELFAAWRSFERPQLVGGVPDYGAKAMAAKAVALQGWRKRLDAIDTRGWPVEQVTDHRLVKAEMNGLDFNLRVLRPWARDPSFYISVWAQRSDVPSREGPTLYPEIQLYNYRFPLSATAQAELKSRLAAIPVLLAQARVNLKDSNAHDLWAYSVQGLREQSDVLDQLAKGTLVVGTLEGSQRADLTGTDPALLAAVGAARQATEDFTAWVDGLSASKTGPSGVGKANYTWYQQNVHFVPYSWDDEVALLRRELERTQASLKLEEHNNRKLPPLEPAATAAAFDRLSRARLDKFVGFLVEQEIIPAKPYLKAALEPQMGSFVPADKREFFAHVTHREPMLLMSHEYHWIDLARMRDEPNPDPIRRGPLLSNIWDNRAEGFATAFEELVMHAGLYDDNPRAKELVWIMLANRAARGLASLYVQSNDKTLEQASHFQGEWTPRGWSNPKGKLTGFEQLLYLRQPGYGTSYITGKLLFDRLLTDYAHQQDKAGKPFALRELMDRFNNGGMIPTTLAEDEIVGK